MHKYLIATFGLINMGTQTARAIEVPMSAAEWDSPSGTTFERREGFPAGIITVPRDIAVLKTADFSDGTIEFDVKALEFSDTGIQFRRKESADSEFVYIRADPDCPAANDCVQYAPITHGLMQWDLYPQFQAQAPISEKGWNHIRIVVAKRVMQVFVNREPRASLTVDRLRGLTDTGGIALKGPAAFANLQLRPNEVSGLTLPPQSIDSHPQKPIEWLVGPPVPLSVNEAPVPSTMPGTNAWRSVSTEPDGLVNLSREFGPTDAPAVVWLKTRVQSNGVRDRLVHLGWARQIWLYVNGKLTYSADNPYYPEEARLQVDGRFSPENATIKIQLHDGGNDILLAVGNRWRTYQGSVKASPYGWGAAMSFVEP